MSVRSGLWLGGGLAVVAAGVLLPWGSGWREVGPGLLGLGAVLLGLVAESVTLLVSVRRAGSRSWPIRDPRPADGVVGLSFMAGVEGVPNASDPRFRRFSGLEPAFDQGPARGRVPRDRPPPLRGKVVLIPVFLGRDGRGWSDEESAQALAALIRAGQWVEREAIRWNAPVNAELSDTYFAVDEAEMAPDEVEIQFLPKGDEIEPFEAHAVTKALIETSRSAARLGFRDAVDWMDRIDPRVDADTCVWLLLPRNAGRSIAVPLDLTELAGVSLAVCYPRYADFPEPLGSRPPTVDTTTIVHELLHLFGATDKYNVPLRSFPNRSVTSRDVMLLNETSLARLRVDPRTAWEIGWASGR